MARTIKTVLITGASGFLGSHIVNYFCKKGFQTYSFVRSSSNLQRLQLLGCHENKTIITDITNPKYLNHHLGTIQPDILIHCAAYGVDYRQQDVGCAIDINIKATTQLIESAARHKIQRFLHIGTCYEYGDHAVPITEESCLRPIGLYGASKAASSLMALQCAAINRLSLTVLRFANMYGPLEGEHKLIPQMIQACRHQQHLSLTPGNQLRDYLYVNDAADACYNIATLDDFPNQQIINIASGRSISIRDIGDVIVKKLGGSCFLNWGAHQYRTDESMCIEINNSLIKSFGWNPATDLTLGLENTIAASIHEHKDTE